MRIITILFALFLSLLQGNAPVDMCSCEQDICVENVVDVEEEAIVRSNERIQKEIEAPVPFSIKDFSCHKISNLHINHIRYCFDATWLMACCFRI